MSSYKPTSFGIIPLALGLLTVVVGTLPFLPVPQEQAGGLVVFLGRFHPMLLHFPIVLILLCLGGMIPTYHGHRFSWIPAKLQGKTARDVVDVLLALSIVSALITVFGGFLLYQSGDYQGALIRQHLWGGVLLALVLNGAGMVRWLERNGPINRTFFQIFVILAGGLVIITSHLGATITHGKDFLTEHMPTLTSSKPAPVELKEPKDLLVFQDLIMPVIDKQCLSCHNQYKTKGGLLLESLSDLQAGGKSGKPLLVAGEPENSELFHRITLPADDEDRMPPPEKAPLAEGPVALIRWWIESGATEDMVLGASPPDSIQSLLEGYLPQLYQSERLRIRQQEDFEALAEEVSGLGDQLGLAIKPDPENEGLFGVSMTMPPSIITDQSVSALTPYASLISKLSLPGAEITDDALYNIASMTRLQSLYLPRTRITGEGLVYLKSIPQLKEINLSNSLLTNEGILNLTYLAGLDRAYILGAPTDTIVLQALRKHLPGVEILEEEGPYY